MRKKAHPIFAISLAAASLGAALLVLAGARGPRAAVLPAAGAADLAAASFDFSRPADWMSRNAALLSGRKLAQLILPGAHDAASYSLRPDSRACPSRIDVRASLVAFFMAARARAQDASIAAQLRAGVRYLDLRVCALRDPAGRTSYVTHHTFLGAPLGDVLDDVDAFTRAHPREIVILDFQDLNGFRPADRSALQAQLERRFGDRMLRTTANPAAATMAEVWKQGASLVVVMDAAQPSPHIFDRAAMLESRWFNAQSVSMLERLATALRPVPARLHVLQWQLTPGELEFLFHPTSTLKEFAEGPNALIADGTLRRLLPPRQLNVVMTDDVMAVAGPIARMNALR